MTYVQPANEKGQGYRAHRAEGLTDGAIGTCIRVDEGGFALDPAQRIDRTGGYAVTTTGAQPAINRWQPACVSHSSPSITLVSASDLCIDYKRPEKAWH
jgi:hypothetical protein